MKEIDLIPQWYKEGKRKQRSLRSQYMILAGIVTIMLVWNFITANSISKAEAKYQNDRQHRCRAQALLQQSNELENKIKKLQKKATLLDAVDSHINIAGLLSELSFLIGDNIVLSEVKFVAEKFSGPKQNKTGTQSIRLAGAGAGKYGTAPLGNVRFKGLIRGIADQTGDVGALVRRLEGSDCFHSVSLAFSRSKSIKLKSQNDSPKRQVSEFEISCYLANYRLLAQSGS